MKKGRASKSDVDVGPTTSGVKTEAIFQEKDLIRFELIARSLSRARDGRDRRETAIITKLSAEHPELPIEEIKAKVAQEISDLNVHIESEEKRIAGDLLEEILKNPDYNCSTLDELIPNLSKPSIKEVTAGSSDKTVLEPIEVQVDEAVASGTKDEPPLSAVSTGDSNEAQVLQRVAELRKQGLWTNSRLPLCVDPPRNKTHWDYLLEEVKWMANDFRQERLFKRKMARALSGAIAKQQRDQELEAEKAEQRVVKDGRRICASIAKLVKEFWMNVDKVVDYRAQEILENRKRKALDQHLAFIVGEADKLSSMVQEGLTQDKSSKSPSITSKQDQDDREFVMNDADEESDNESTLSKEEENINDTDYKDELAALSNDATGDLDDLLASLPAEYLSSIGVSLPGPSKSKREPSMTSSTTGEESAQSSSKDLPEDTPSQKSRSRNGNYDENTVELNGEGNGDGRGVLQHVDYAKLNSSDANEREQELAHIAEQALMFQPKGFTLETTQVKTPIPSLIRGSLREYQMVGLDWLVTLYEKNLNGILADEMGLGKTIQTIALLAHLAGAESIWGPHLIVVPTSVILNWEMELKKWCPAFKILTYFGSVKERAEKRKGWSKPNAFHICITSYKTVTADIRSFKMKAWQYMILDEAQNIKNWKSQRWQALLNIRARRRLLLTGTPLQNSLMELWSLMHFLMPAIFASHDDFKDWFSNPLTGMMEGSVEYNAPLVQRLHKILRPFILRRLKSEVEKQLPEKTETIVKCQLSKRQRYLYDDFMSRRSTKENLRTGNMFSVLNIVMQLRKCCNHPNLFEPRPVLSPFILPSIKKVFPAAIFDLVGENALQENLKTIPECLDLTMKFTGWTSVGNGKKPSIEELKRWDNPMQPPKLEGFHFDIPALQPQGAASMSASPTVSILDGLSPAEVQRVGLIENEQFLLIGDNDEKSLVNGDARHALKVRVKGSRVVVDKSGASSAPRPRVCKVVTIKGEKTLMDVSKNGETGFQEPTVPEPSSASLPSSSASVIEKNELNHNDLANSALSTRTVGLKTNTVRRNVNIHPAFKTHTKTFSQPLEILTEVKGFNSALANGGARENISNFEYRFSPPLKRKRIQEIPLIRGQYSAYVPQDYKTLLADEKTNRLEIARCKFNAPVKRILPNELLFVIKEKLRTKGSFCTELSAVKKIMEDCADILLNKFPLYVEPAQAESPAIVANSLGRSYSAKVAENMMEAVARKCLRSTPKEVDARLLSSKLQFPELRLIEYDCGKLQVLAGLLRQLYIYKHRCLIFTQMSKMLDILQAFLSHHGYQYFRLDGTTGIEQRQCMMERFNADSRIFCFILSTRSGGIGVNLTGADTVIFYDSDWNPTMDAQAQDRCHRIGQTRNVTIYRLISERTIEENILKKAMQKRRLGEMAIDDAGFTPDFFKQSDNIRDLFEGDVADVEIAPEVAPPKDQKELEKVMASLEDEQDVAASKMATAEARADRAEFDDARRDVTTSYLGGEESQDDKYIELITQLKPIERYALKFLEAEYKPDFEEECKEAEALIEQKKEDWVKAHEKAVTDEYLNDDDFYGCGSILDEVLASDNIFADLPTWCPPTPPLSPSQGNDLYYDDCLDLLYDPDFMGESKLPSIIHELHRPLVRTPSPTKRLPPPPSPAVNKNKAVMDLLNAAAMSSYSSTPLPISTHDSSMYYPEYGTDFGCPGLDPYGQVMRKERRERSGRERDPNIRLNREAPRPITPPTSLYEQEDYEGPEWTIIEDHALLEAVQQAELMGHNPSSTTCTLHFNWRYIADAVNKRMAPIGHYRSERQCCIRYQVVVRPREAGHLHTVDPLTKKPRKVPFTQNELNHLKKNRSTTGAQYEHDHPQIIQDCFMARGKLIRELSKRSRKPQRSYADTLPQVVPTQMPDNFENKLKELNLSGLRTVLPEDMVRKQEEMHFTALEANRQRAAEKQFDADTQRGIPPQISLRNAAIPAEGVIESKAPYMLELPAVQIRLPPPPQRTMLHGSNSISQLIGADHSMSGMHSISNVPRRVGSVGGSLSHMVSSSTTGNYVVVGQNEHPQSLRRTDPGPNAMFRLGPQQVRRTPPGTPLLSGHPRNIGYVSSQGNQSGPTYIANQGGTSNVYGGSSTLAQARPGPQSGRIVSRPGQQSRLFVNPERTTTYVMGPSAQQQVRLVPGNGVQRVAGNNVQKRMPSKPPGSVTTVMPNIRPPGPSGAIQQFRTVRPMTRGGSISQGTRVMNVVMSGPTMRNQTGHVMGQGGLTRQLLTTRGGISSRTGSPQTIAQVVIAPPTSMQQQSPQQSISNVSQHPPSLTPQHEASPSISDETPQAPIPSSPTTSSLDLPAVQE